MMKTPRSPLTLLKGGAAERRASVTWPGWAARRAGMFNYFAGVFLGTVLFALYFRAAHPHYQVLQYQVTLLQFALSGVVLVWFVPAMVRDFRWALRGSSPRLRVGSLGSAVWPLAANVITLAFLASAALMPLITLLPVDAVIKDYPTETFILPWGLHVLVVNLVFMIYLIAAVGISTALLLLIRSLILYRFILAILLALWLFSGELTSHLWHILFNAPFSLEPVWDIVVRGGYPFYFGHFISMVDGGRYAYSMIHILWIRIVLEMVGRLISSLVLTSVALWLAAVTNEVIAALRRKRSEPPQKPRAVAKPWFALFTSVLVVGALAQPLLRASSTLPGTVRSEGGSGTPYGLLLLVLILAVIYLVIAVGADAIRSGRRSGLGRFLPEVIRAFHRNGAALAVGFSLVGLFYLTVFARTLGYGSAAIAAGVVLLLLVAAVALVIGTAIVVCGRLARAHSWLSHVAEGLGVILLAAVVTFFLFLREAPERLVAASDGMKSAATPQAAEALRLGSCSYMALVRAWLNSFEAAAQSAGGLWQLILGIVAVIAALAVATNLLARLTRRLA